MDSINGFAKMMAEAQLQVLLWDNIKKDWWEPAFEGQLYLDDKDNVLAVKIEGSIAIVGYLHFYHDMHKQPNFQYQILKSATEFVLDLKKIAVEQGWNKGKIIIVTPYKLSGYKGMNFNNIPDDATYFYMTESPEAEKKTYNLHLDQGIIDYKAAHDPLEYLFEKGRQLTAKPAFWNCQICGGDNETGCLYFDPSECPRFT